MKGFIRKREGRDGRSYQANVKVDGDVRSLGTYKLKKVKEEHREMDFLNPEEVRRLLDACSLDFYPICFAAIMTGLRQGELFGLRWADVDFENRVIRVNRSYHPSRGFTSTKSEKGQRTVVLTPDLAHVLVKRVAGVPMTSFFVTNFVIPSITTTSKNGSSTRRWTGQFSGEYVSTT